MSILFPILIDTMTNARVSIGHGRIETIIKRNKHGRTKKKAKYKFYLIREEPDNPRYIPYIIVDISLRMAGDSTYVVDSRNQIWKLKNSHRTLVRTTNERTIEIVSRAIRIWTTLNVDNNEKPTTKTA